MNIIVELAIVGPLGNAHEMCLFIFERTEVGSLDNTHNVLLTDIKIRTLCNT